MLYRPDIDGLRAIAVCLVLLSHLGVTGASGGFVGVDIFFVISGYLITGNIARSIANGTFTILDFYELRFRRIIPALIGVLAATSTIAYLLFLPADLERFAQALLAALFSYSNLYFYSAHSGYFTSTYSNILFHTWSLGVEEQFYLVIPVGMMLAAHFRHGMRWMVRIAASLSFVAAACLAFQNRDLAFYMPYLRAWELLAGSFVALGRLPRPASTLVRELMAAASLLLIALSTIFYKPAYPFPGISALPPCAAAVMLIFIGESGKTRCSSLLSSRPFVFVGLISYSLYLWHWPIIVLVKLGAVHGIQINTLSGDVAVIVASLVCGWASWRFVEQPFRVGRLKKLARPRIFKLTAVCAAFLALIACLLHVFHGFPHRFPPEARIISTYLDTPPEMRQGSCFIETAVSKFDTSTCLAERSDGKNILLFGDSHAAVFWRGLTLSMPGLNILQATFASCPPIFGAYKRSNCSKFRHLVYGEYLPAHHIDAVILTERWSSIQNLDDLQSAIDWFRSRDTPVFIIGPVPEYTVPLPYLLALGLKWHDPSLASRNRIGKFQQLDQQLGLRLQNEPGVHYASAWKAICPNSVCAEYASNAVPLLADVDHLTNEGSIAVIKKLQRSGDLPGP